MPTAARAVYFFSPMDIEVDMARRFLKIARRLESTTVRTTSFASIIGLRKEMPEINITASDAGSDDSYYIMQWQCTPLGPPLQRVAVLESNPALYHYGVNFISPEYFPTVILHDAVGLFQIDRITEPYYDATMQALVIGLNLYMVSQNCDVSRSKNPLAKKPSASGSAASKMLGGFQGIIFANGTRLDHIPPGFTV